MSHPTQGVPRHFQPMMHNEDYAHWDAAGWGSSWGPHGQQRPNAAYIAGFDQSQTPLVLRTLGGANGDGGPSSITPLAGTLTLRAVAVSTSSATATLTLTRAEAPSVRIARPPATRLISVLSSVLVKSYFDRVIAPYIAQEQHEHYEALLRKDFRQARVVGARMYPMIFWIIFRSIVAPVIRLITRGE
jgi:hypothetical protein